MPRRDGDRQLKLGPGGLRDVEFSVQLLQLVHGRSDALLRSPTHAPGAGGARRRRVRGPRGRRDPRRRLHASCGRSSTASSCTGSAAPTSFPTDEADLRRLARSLGMRSDPAAELIEPSGGGTRARCAACTRSSSTARCWTRWPGSTPARPGSPRRRRARGCRPSATPTPPGALRHLEALTSGVSRRAAIQRTLLPVMLGWFADAADPDGGLLAFRRVSDALGSTPWYLRLLRDEGAVAERMAHVLASSRYAADLLLRAPEAVQMLADDERADRASARALVAEALAAVARHDDRGGGRRRGACAATPGAVPHRRRRAAGVAEVDEAAIGLSNIADATIAGALAAAARAVGGEAGAAHPVRRHRDGPLRRRRARLRQRRRRHVRPRPAAGHRRA